MFVRNIIYVICVSAFFWREMLQLIIEKIKTTVNTSLIKVRLKSVLKYKKIKVHF